MVFGFFASFSDALVVVAGPDDVGGRAVVSRRGVRAERGKTPARGGQDQKENESLNHRVYYSDIGCRQICITQGRKVPLETAGGWVSTV